MDLRKLFARAANNWPAKVISLALAIILFIIHRMGILETRFFFTEIAIEHLSAMMPSASYPRMIRVSLRGEANNLNSILENDIEAYVDMEKIDAPGVYKVPVQWRKKGTALEVEPLQISVDPAEITFSLDYRISKFVPLAASFLGRVETGYNMTSYSLNPAQVIVEGPAALMGSISELNTDFIDLAGRKENFTLTAAILQRDPLLVMRGNGTTEFSGHISQIITVRNLHNVPIVITGLHEGFSGELEINTGSIHLEGENQAAVENFEAPPDFLQVDCGEIFEPGIYLLKVLPGTAEGVRLKAEPAELEIVVSWAEDVHQW